MKRLLPRTVLVTGASSGIGRALVLEYARRGANVVASARREAELASLVDVVKAVGGSASYRVCDVTDTAAATELVKAAERDLGSLDLVISNAGVGGTTHATRLDMTNIAHMIDVNVRGAIAPLVAAIPIMLAQQQGQLVGVSSLAGRRALPTASVYNASKAALSMFLETLQLDLESAGISITDVQPGFVETELTAKNTFPMPFLWTAEKAARVIARRLEGAPRVIAFPLPMDLLTRFSKHLPFAVHAAVTRALCEEHLIATDAGVGTSEQRLEIDARECLALGRESRTGERRELGGDAGHVGLGDLYDRAIHAQPLEGHEVAFELGEGGLVERPMVVEMCPIVQTPNERTQR